MILPKFTHFFMENLKSMRCLDGAGSNLPSVSNGTNNNLPIRHTAIPDYHPILQFTLSLQTSLRGPAQLLLVNNELNMRMS
jgi:hypothetical protein